jgi:integrase
MSTEDDPNTSSAPLRTSGPDPTAAQPPRLLDQIRARIRYRHYSPRTERAYVDWARRFILFHGKRHPRDLGAPEVEAFLSYLAHERGLAASSHQQALAALLFLYQEVLGIELPWLSEIGRPKQAKRVPAVLSVDEVRAVLARMDGMYGLMARLIYGAGLRLMECVRLRVKDLDLARKELTVGGAKARRTA